MSWSVAISALAAFLMVAPLYKKAVTKKEYLAERFVS